MSHTRSCGADQQAWIGTRQLMGLLSVTQPHDNDLRRSARPGASQQPACIMGRICASLYRCLSESSPASVGTLFNPLFCMWFAPVLGLPDHFDNDNVYALTRASPDTVLL